jgi:uncharacterized protein (TIGR02271 family)
MAKTIVALYDDFSDAQRAVNELVNSGIARDDISIVANDATGEYGQHLDVDRDEGTSGTMAGAGIGAVLGGIGGLLIGLGALAIPGIGPVIAAGPIVTTLAGAGIGAVAGGLVGALVDLGVPEEEAHYYAEGVRRGGSLVTVTTSDAMAEEVVDILENYDPVDIEERATQWQESGWSGFDAEAEPYTAGTTREHSAYTGARYTDEDEGVIEVAQEELKVGKRMAERGRVRVHAHVVEEPVSETVQLREEHVDVQRRPANRPASTADLDAFEEGTIEIPEMREELVTSKEARVVEEVVVHKNVTERPETIHETLRHTEVDIDESDDDYDYGFDDDAFRRHYDSNYARSGYGYDQYAPAYRYGYDLRNNARYQGRDWATIEPEVRRDWERRHPDSAWENFKDAVRHGWNKMTS